MLLRSILLLGKYLNAAIICLYVYQLCRLFEFPQPGDATKHLLPILIDPELAKANPYHIPLFPDVKKVSKVSEQKQFWMPVKDCIECISVCI